LSGDRASNCGNETDFNEIGMPRRSHVFSAKGVAHRQPVATPQGCNYPTILALKARINPKSSK
jgi:hypothetical protein